MAAAQGRDVGQLLAAYLPPPPPVEETILPPASGGAAPTIDNAPPATGSTAEGATAPTLQQGAATGDSAALVTWNAAVSVRTTMFSAQSGYQSTQTLLSKAGVSLRRG